jgi:type I restriction enzyme R subunit
MPMKLAGTTSALERRCIGEVGKPVSLYFADILQAQLMKLNPGNITPDRAAEILRRLNLLTPGIAGNWEALKWMRGEQSLFVSEANRELNITLIDFDHPERNLFHVTDDGLIREPPSPTGQT